MTTDEEIALIGRIMEALEPCSSEELARVVSYVNDWANHRLQYLAQDALPLGNMRKRDRKRGQNSQK